MLAIAHLPKQLVGPAQMMHFARGDQQQTVPDEVHGIGERGIAAAFLYLLEREHRRARIEIFAYERQFERSEPDL